MTNRDYEELRYLREERTRLEERAAYHTEVEGVQREQIAHLERKVEQAQVEVSKLRMDLLTARNRALEYAAVFIEDKMDGCCCFDVGQIAHNIRMLKVPDAP